MNTTLPLRLGACAALTGVVAQLAATVLEPDWGGEPHAAIRAVAGSTLWNTNRLVDLIGVLLTVVALTIAGRMLGTAGSEWAHIAQPFLIVLAALGASAIATGAAMKETADTWADAEGTVQASYFATFDGLVSTTEVLFFASFMALGLYLAALAVAILAGAVFAHWIGWAAAVGAVLVTGGNLLIILFDAAWFAVLGGFAVFLVMVGALGLSMWHRATAPEPELVQSDVR